VGKTKPGQPQHRGTWVAEGRLCSTGPMSTVCKKHVSPIYPVRDSSRVIGNVSPLLGCLVTAESANDAAPSVMPWLRVAKGQRYAVSAGNVEMMELVAGGFCLKVATASSHARRSGLGRKVLRGSLRYFGLLYFRLPKLCCVRCSAAAAAWPPSHSHIQPPSRLPCQGRIPAQSLEGIPGLLGWITNLGAAARSSHPFACTGKVRVWTCVAKLRPRPPIEVIENILVPPSEIVCNGTISSPLLLTSKTPSRPSPACILYTKRASHCAEQSLSISTSEPLVASLSNEDLI